MLIKFCKRCGAVIRYPRTYCESCQALVNEEREAYRTEAKRKADREYNRRRDPKYIRFYNSEDWKILSATYIQDRGYRCECCGKIATEVHHVDPIQTPSGWDRRLDYTNLEALCTACHNKRHGRFQPRKRRGSTSALSTTRRQGGTLKTYTMPCRFDKK